MPKIEDLEQNIRKELSRMSIDNARANKESFRIGIHLVEGRYKLVSYKCLYKLIKYHNQERFYAFCHFEESTWSQNKKVAPLFADNVEGGDSTEWKSIYDHQKYKILEIGTRKIFQKDNFIKTIEFLSDLNLPGKKAIWREVNDIMHKGVHDALDFFEKVNKSMGLTLTFNPIINLKPK